MHQKLLNAPKSWKVSRKKNKFSQKINPGPHSKELAISPVIILRDYLGVADTKKECKKILHKKLFFVDKKPISKTRYAIGLFDVVSIPEHKIFYRLSLDNKGKLSLIEISKKEAEYKPLKINKKTRIKNKQIQLNCSSGRNIIVKKDVYKTGDTVMYDLSKNKIKNHIKSSPGKLVFITRGKHAGTIANVKKFKIVKGSMPDRVVLTSKKGKSFETLEDYIFVIGDKKPEFKVV